MSRYLVACSGALVLALAACSQAGPGSATGEGGATVEGSGGATGSGGSSTTGGGGTTTGGSGGATGTGGTVGTGGSKADGGTGGTAGTGGASGTGGTAGTGGSPALNINDIVPGFDGYYWEATPSGNTALSGTNYPYGPPAGGCPTGATWATTGYINTRTLAVKGTTNQPYTINFNVRGVVGTRCYTGGTPASTATPNPSGPNNTWYVGGQQFNDSIWNTMEIHVTPPVPNAANVYYANSFPNVSNWCQKEATYEARYNASFQVMGGGTLTFVIHDSNCRTLSNCGAVENQATCDTTASRIIDMSGLNPPATNFAQPRTASLGGTTYYIQWVWFDVTSVTSP
jgi:hypothetical protein